jgi:squalene synthase HpnC
MRRRAKGVTTAGAASLPGAAAVMGQASEENFPVASLVLPRRVRSHLLAIYGFARLVDDVGDEVSGDRLGLLDGIEADLERLWSGDAPRQPLIARLDEPVAAHALPIDPFRALIEANRRDQLVHRYQTFTELLAYCRLSANPVGELVLRVFAAATPERIALSDQLCTALQLAEHWQDVAEDYEAGRIYLPAEDLERFGVQEEDLAARSAPPSLRALMAFEVRRARQLLDQGAPLARTLRGRPGFAVHAFVAGGRSALRAIEHADYDVLAATPRAGRAARARQLVLELVRGGRR